jgi:hypothetical protein
MEIVKDIAAAIGLILSIISLMTIFTKGGRTFVKNLFKKNTQEINDTNCQQNKDIEEIKQLLNKSSVDMELVKDGVKQQLRNTIKNIYYKYRVEKRIPIYERKTADATYALYNGGFHSNSYISLLYQEICKWDIDEALDRDIDED